VNKLAVERAIDDAFSNPAAPKTQSFLSNEVATHQLPEAIASYDHGFRIPWPLLVKMVKLRPAPTEINQIYVQDAVTWNRARGFRNVYVRLQNGSGGSRVFWLWSSDTEQLCLIPT
jgi:hypothetical protein